MSKFSWLKAFVVAGLLLPFSAAIAEATSIPTTAITCGFGTNASHCGGSSTDNIFVFDGGAYSIELDFGDGIPRHVGFDVTVTDSPLTDPVPAGEECLNMTGTPDGCRQFDFVLGSGAQWNGGTNGIQITLAWLLDTNAQYPNGTTDQVRLIHDHLGTVTDITLPGSYFSAPPTGCQNDHGHPNHPDPNPGHGCDPGVTGTEDSFSADAFSGFYGTHEIVNTDAAAVPEPGTMMLLGGGLVALLARRRARV